MEYREYLLQHPGEWSVLDSMCRITISRFYRDRGIQDALRDRILPAMLHEAAARGDAMLRVWSAGCGSGEEPYTLAIIQALHLQSRFPGVQMNIMATDVDPALLQRARKAQYLDGSLKDLPSGWREQAFERENGLNRLKPEYRRGITFLRQDIRKEQPGGPFDLVLCRNLVFTYFDEILQARLLHVLCKIIRPGGVLVIGAHEKLPGEIGALPLVKEEPKIFRKHAGP